MTFPLISIFSYSLKKANPLMLFFLFSVEGELEQEQEVVEVEQAWERRGQQWSKHFLLLTARSQLPENHTAAAAAMQVTTGINSSSTSQNTSDAA